MFLSIRKIIRQCQFRTPTLCIIAPRVKYDQWLQSAIYIERFAHFHQCAAAWGASVIKVSKLRAERREATVFFLLKTKLSKHFQPLKVTNESWHFGPFSSLWRLSYYVNKGVCYVTSCQSVLLTRKNDLCMKREPEKQQNKTKTNVMIHIALYLTEKVKKKICH